MSSFFLPAFSFAVLGPLLGALAMAGADLVSEHLAAGIKGAHFPKARDHPQSLPDALLSQLAHQSPHLVKMVDKLLDLMRLRTAARGNAATSANVDDVWVAPFLLGHRVDDALN